MKNDLDIIETDIEPTATTELQCIDCNCNDCIFMLRDTEKFKISLIQHERWQFDYFLTVKNKLIKAAEFAKKKDYDLLKWSDLLGIAEKMKFQFNKSDCTINYGTCSRDNTKISFIPNILQLYTHSCFRHRRVWQWK